ncbi:MAG: NnrU family protein [Gammaproteobacteria bacterium]|nr:NnrU family protein [Gammaproteobacteria bacterium]
MTQLIAGLVTFFAPHSVSIFAVDWRDRMAATYGAGWKAAYAIVSLIGLVLVARGYAELRNTPTVLYVTPYWMRHVSAVLLLPVFVLFLASIFPGRIQTATKNPLLVATKLWALAHLLVNGTLADVLLFGSFLVWAVLDRISLKRRTPRAVPGAPASAANDVIVVVAGLALYAVTVVWAHAALFGVPVIPG